MAVQARLAHVNLIARDWRRLAAFYADVFACVPVPPERDLTGAWLDRATGLPRVRIQGVHLRFPGQEPGMTLELFQYDSPGPGDLPAVNRPGFSHVGVAVPDVSAARAAVLSAGGGTIGDTVSVEIAGAGRITFVYATDPEGNILELQQWSP
jgi:catechol 2,3-dioxygenase-like lactoylglutathione lyase family enzyme